MRTSLTAVLERDGITGPLYASEPYEVAWASEARWFVRALSFPAAIQRVSFTVQVSPDGLHWCDHSDVPPILQQPGLVSWVTREFGGWLRLRAAVDGAATDTSVPALIHLALKA